MMIISLKQFQQKAIADLRKQFFELWHTNNRRLPLVFQSPTGSGKTLMIAQFLKVISNDPQFDVDKAFLWFSFSEESCDQSKKKLFDYYGGANEISLMDQNDLSKGKLEKNNIFFINWQKIKSSTKEGRILRNPSEFTSEEYGIFDEFIKRTQNDGRDLVLIVDEAHRETDTELAEELVDLVDPRIIIKITATPKTIPSASDVGQKRAGFVEVVRKDVIDEGLIKEKIITQTKEDLAKLSKKEMDQDIMLLELAYDKRIQIKRKYEDLKLPVNPLVLIQLPNDDQITKEKPTKLKLDIVKDYLKSKKISECDIAIWTADKKETFDGKPLDFDEIRENDSPISFLIFKQAAATGWDCPRASILVMYREIKSPIFHTQTVGRILRMPEGTHYPKPELNAGYLFTNYERNQIKLPDNKQGENKPYILVSSRKAEIKPIILQSVFMGRTDYNDLGDSFQTTFKEIADAYFNTNEKRPAEKNKQNIIAKGLRLEGVKVENKLIVDAEIENYDDFVNEIKSKGEDLIKATSKNDIERMYNLLCFNIISKQEEETKKFAPERSWGKVKTALNVWFSQYIKEERITYYTIIVNDLLRPDSILTKVISESLERYRPIRQEEVNKKESRAKRIEDLEIPRPELLFTDDYEALPHLSKNAMDPIYLKKNYDGRENEIEFIKYIETKKIDWWYKNGDHGSEHFSISFYDECEKRETLFYPDWIIKIKKDIFIFDTKQGLKGTAGSQDTKRKAEALQSWINKQNNHGYAFKGGIITRVSGIWKINDNCTYTIDGNYSNWKNLDDII